MRSKIGLHEVRRRGSNKEKEREKEKEKGNKEASG
jgi:hypothetical protein